MADTDIPSMSNEDLLDLAHQNHVRAVNGGTQGQWLDKLNAEILRR